MAIGLMSDNRGAFIVGIPEVQSMYIKASHIVLKNLTARSSALACAFFILFSFATGCEAKETDSSVDLKKAEFYMQRRLPDRALPFLDSVIAREPKHTGAMLLKANALSQMKKFPEARVLVSSVLRLEPRNVSALALGANIKFAQGELRESAKDIKEVIRLDPKNAPARILLAQLFEREGKQKEAMQECEKAVQLEPNNAAIWRQTAVVQRAIRRPHLTVSAFQKAIALAPNDVINYDELASFFFDRKSYEKALLNAQKAIQLNPEDGFAHLIRGRILMAWRKLREALASAEAAERSLPYSGEPNALKGELYQRMMDDDASVLEYNKAIAKQPQVPRFYMGRGTAELGRRNFDASIKDFTHAHELSRGDATALSMRSDVYEGLNKWDLAYKDLTECIKANPKATTLYLRRAVALRHLHRVPEAVADYNKAVELEPSDINYERRGDFYLQSKELNKAVADFKAALRVQPANKKALQGLSSAYEGLGHKDLAADARNRATGDMERVIDQYSRTSDGFNRLKRSLGK